jgi:hypothetical protein
LNQKAHRSLPRQSFTARAAALALGLALALPLALAAPRAALAAADDGAPTQEKIDAAIAKGQAFLLSQMKAPGRWEHDDKRTGNDHNHYKMQGSTWGGFTAIATYALLASGKSARDPQVEPAIKFLKTADITGAYALGLRAQVWAYLPRSPEILRLYKQDAEALTRTLNMRGRAAGLWDYQDMSNKGDSVDHSVSQYGVLGLWACTQGGAEINGQLWAGMDQVWRKRQYSTAGGPTTATRTPRRRYRRDDRRRRRHAVHLPGVPRGGRGLNCTGNPPDEAIERGLKWMADHFRRPEQQLPLVRRRAHRRRSGRKYFGDKDWYATGVRTVLANQKPDGSFASNFIGSESHLRHLLRAAVPGRGPLARRDEQAGLPRGRSRPSAGAAAPAPAAPAAPAAAPAASAPATAPAGGATWNQRPRDVANITRWMGKRNERYLNWQVVNLTASAGDLLDAPILYVSGSERLDLAPEHVAKLRQFAEDGGLIVGNADCASEPFARSFRELGKRMFPRYAFRELPVGHSINAGQQFRAEKWKERVSLEGLGNGSRELMLLLPANLDAGRAWQQRADRGRSTCSSSRPTSTSTPPTSAPTRARATRTW